MRVHGPTGIEKSVDNFGMGPIAPDAEHGCGAGVQRVPRKFSSMRLGFGEMSLVWPQQLLNSGLQPGPFPPGAAAACRWIDYDGEFHDVQLLFSRGRQCQLVALDLDASTETFYHIPGRSVQNIPNLPAQATPGQGGKNVATEDIEPFVKNFSDRIYRMNMIKPESRQRRRCYQVPSTFGRGRVSFNRQGSSFYFICILLGYFEYKPG